MLSYNLQKQALYWETTESGRVLCLLCPHGCRIAEGQLGLCQVRQNVDGILRTLNYGRVAAVHMDPIEKKPLFHFYPGSSILSLGTIGCNLACSFCQNWTLSHVKTGTRSMTPEEAVAIAQKEKGNIGIAYTYNEPFIWYEFVLETASLAVEAGLKNVMVTNGYVKEEPLRELLPYIHALNIDIKSMQEDFYRELCRSRSGPPRETAEIAKQHGCHVELTNLIIPNWNDRPEDFTTLMDWVAGLDPDIPVHFSRYHPDYKMTEPPTPLESLFKAREIASRKLHYVYIGNVWGASGENTICPGCGEVAVARAGFKVLQVNIKKNRCKNCEYEISMVGT